MLRRETGLFEHESFNQTPIIKLTPEHKCIPEVALCGDMDREVLKTSAQQAIQWINIEEITYEQYADVLYQPETKAKQVLDLGQLHRPDQALDLSFDWTKPEQWIIDIERPQAGQSYAFRIRVADNTQAKLILKTTLPVCDDENEVVKEDRPAVFLDVQVGQDAQLDVVYLHPLYADEASLSRALKAKAALACLYKANVGRGGSFKWTSINLGESLIEKGQVTLVDSFAEADLGGASYVPAASSQIYQSQVRCLATWGKVKIHNHGVVENGGYGKFVSISDIRKGAKNTLVREDNRFLTLGEGAKAYADPTLLIDEHDVQASHAATVGQMNEETMFYLKSRGLSEAQATRLMTIGFLIPLIDRVPQEALRAALISVLNHKINQQGGDQ